ncbi:hypothetical protein H6G33_30780 [Calothrix sp. FACHB-1219]|uniref:hypothetical protein n=1 Tax=unclassified Calothrix TaxID=2619626 RepID=UPI001683A503|nr:MULTISPECIES: hypothetical protein [unclassified Calothrix]MBD2206564.1 hypothetical protein [Calothrix sp. FACHB-168]MBD2221359.1 hypothetical protein [Calothrix sp. FACHB-1219]
MKDLIDKNLIHPSQTKPSYQIKIVFFTFLATITPVTLIFLLLNIGQKTGLGYLTRDPAALTNTPFYIGLFSNIGILLWCSCATICLFSYAILNQNNRSQELAGFLLFSGLLTSFLTLDDLLMLHEEVFPLYLKFPEKLFYVLYLMTILFGFGKNFKAIKKTEFIILSASVVFFILSILSDKIHNHHIVAVMEDIFKIIGISTWLTYLTRLCGREINSLLRLSKINKDF